MSVQPDQQQSIRVAQGHASSAPALEDHHLLEQDVNVTAKPMAERLARQVTEAFPWDEAPRYLIRDRDRAFGSAYTWRVRWVSEIIPSHLAHHGRTGTSSDLSAHCDGNVSTTRLCLAKHTCVGS
jgi:hypothetical protein